MRTKLAISTFVAAAVIGACGTAPASATTFFVSAPGTYSFGVPDGVTSIHVTAQGASGGDASETDGDSVGGLGGVISADIAVTPGESFFAHVGGTGTTISHGVNNVCNNNTKNVPGGPNGGGAGGAGGISAAAGAIGGAGGGGATDLRSAGDQPSDRVIAAGGGGGATCGGADGGDGGTNDGAGSDGPASTGGGSFLGMPGLSGANGGAGGAGGPVSNQPAGQKGGDGTTDGAGGKGGDGSASNGVGGGGGGGGWVGGGGGGGGGQQSSGGAGGAGSSGTAPAATNVANSTASAPGNGSIAITYFFTTTTTVSCDPAPAVGAATTCTATVDGGSAGKPTGHVNFTSNGAGTFDAGSCSLATSPGPGGTSSCSVGYTPTTVGSGTHTISAAFPRTDSFAASNGSVAVTVKPSATTTSVSCAPSSLTAGDSTTCTATVARSAGGTANGTVGFSVGSSCTLSGDSCSVTYTPGDADVGTQTLTASYAGDSESTASSGSTTVAVTGRQQRQQTPPPQTPQQPQDQAPVTVRAALSHRRVRLVHGKASFAIVCHGPTAGTCRGSITLAKTTSFKIDGGKVQLLRVPISARTKAALKRHRLVKATVTINVAQPDGTTKSTRLKITIVR